MERQFVANKLELENVMHWVGESLLQLSVPDRLFGQVTLAIEEAVCNIVKYAYDNLKTPGVVHIFCTCEDGKLIVVIKDQGKPFNPVDKFFAMNKDKKTSSLVEKEGGLGISFIMQCIHNVTYARQGEWNILRLTQPL